MKAVGLYLIVEKTEISGIIKWLTLILFSFMTPLGNLVMIYSPFMWDNRLEITAWVVGMILHISTTILFESAENHRFNFKKLSVILFAILLAYAL